MIRWRLSTFILAAALGWVALTLCACSAPRWLWPWSTPAATDTQGHETPGAHDARLQNAAEAAAGCESIARGYVAPAGLPDVAFGAKAFALATAGQDQIPAAQWTVDHIAQAPAEYHKAGMSAQRHANGTWNLWALGVAAMTIAPALLYAAKFVPGIGPFVEPVGSFLYNRFTLKATRDQEDARDAIYAHVGDLWNGAIAALPTPAAAQLQSKLPPDVLQAILNAPRAPGPSA